jgi:hypothetical protein
MRQTKSFLRLKFAALILWWPLAAHAADFAGVKGDLKTTIDFLESNVCPNPLLSEVCATARTLRPLLLDRPGPVETILDHVLLKIDPNQNADKWESAWADSPDLISIPAKFCTDVGIDQGYCADFRCFIADKAKHPGAGCPTTPLPASTKGSSVLSSPGFDKICRGEFCFPSDRNKAEARRFMELDAKAMASDLRAGILREKIKQDVGSRYRCWVVSEAAMALAASLGFAADDITGSLNDCTTAKALLAKIQPAVALQAGQALALAGRSTVPILPPKKPAGQAGADYTILSSSKDSSSLIRGIAARVDGETGLTGANATAHILLLVDST